MLVHSIATETNQSMNFGCPGKNLIDKAIFFVCVCVKTPDNHIFTQ